MESGDDQLRTPMGQGDDADTVRSESAIPETTRFPTDGHSFGPRAGVAYDVRGKDAR